MFLVGAHWNHSTKMCLVGAPWNHLTEVIPRSTHKTHFGAKIKAISNYDLKYSSEHPQHMFWCKNNKNDVLNTASFSGNY